MSQEATVSESKSPMELLESRDIHERAEAGRQLSRCGLPEDVPRLLEVAFDDPSPGVRLYAIGAAADILSRYRVGPPARALDQAARTRLLETFRTTDPGDNAGMFSVVATLGLPKAVRRILVGLADPRLDVRTGAQVGVYRYFVSTEAAADDETRSKVQELILQARIRPDTKAALVRLCGYCGWTEARSMLKGLAGGEDQVAVAAREVLVWLDEAEDPGAVQGVWTSYGTDGGEVPATDKPWTWLILKDGLGLEVGVDRIQAFRYSCRHATRLDIEGQEPWELRRMRLDEPRKHVVVPALQVGTNTWYRTGDKDAVHAAEYFLERAQAVDDELMSEIVDLMLELLPDTAAGQRLAARVELVGGRAESAADRLQTICEKKGAPADAWFYLGEARSYLGDEAAAREAWARCLDRATKRNPLRSLAESRLG
jgi:hypothetical protein